jgi:hypothetical protein
MKQEVCSGLRVVIILGNTLSTVDVTKRISVVFKEIIENVIDHQAKGNFFEEYIA